MKNICEKADTRSQTTDSIDFSSLFTQRLHQNVGNDLILSERRIDKKREGQQEEGETEKEKKKKEEKEKGKN